MQGKNMREVIKMQLKFGQVDISKIKFDIHSRDEIPELLKGLLWIYPSSPSDGKKDR
jgi:hypothetical protein